MLIGWAVGFVEFHVFAPAQHLDILRAIVPRDSVPVVDILTLHRFNAVLGYGEEPVDVNPSFSDSKPFIPLVCGKESTPTEWDIVAFQPLVNRPPGTSQFVGYLLNGHFTVNVQLPKRAGVLPRSGLWTSLGAFFDSEPVEPTVDSRVRRAEFVGHIVHREVFFNVMLSQYIRVVPWIGHTIQSVYGDLTPSVR